MGGHRADAITSTALDISNNPTEKTLLQRQIGTNDRQIDALVYELYGLTDEKIRLVEGISGGH